MTRLARRTVLATGIAAVMTPRAIAQAWPERPVRLVVPAAAGGPTDGYCWPLSVPQVTGGLAAYVRWVAHLKGVEPRPAPSKAGCGRDKE